MGQGLLLGVLVGVSVADFVFVMASDAWALRAVNGLFDVGASAARAETTAVARDIEAGRAGTAGDEGPLLGPVLVNDDIERGKRGDDDRVGRVDDGPWDGMGKGPCMD